MKKINLFLIIVTLVFSFLTIISELDEDFIVILKDASIVLTVTLPYLFEKVTGFKISSVFKTIWIVFIFMAHYLGVIAELYNTISYYDKIVHTVSGVLSASLALIILNNTKSSGMGKAFSVLFIVAFSALCAVSWEVFEYVCDNLFDGDAQRVTLTGVGDTMQDMIVALFGSLMFSVWYVFYGKRLSLKF